MAVKKYLPYLTIGALALAAIFFLTQPRDSTSMQPSIPKVEIKGVPLSVEVVSTEKTRQLGLSGRKELPPETGMLFVFEEEGSWGIWMKDMLFPIDIIWVGSSGSIITIARKVTPDTYPTAFYPEIPTAKYVLEVPAGFADTHALAEGDVIVVQ